MAEIGQEQSAGSVPAWLPRTFSSAVVGCGMTPTPVVVEEEMSDLLNHWYGSGRAYHNESYLGRVIAAFDQLAPTAHTPELLQLAVWYAGLIPPEVVKLNEPNEGELGLARLQKIAQSLTRLGFSAKVVDRVRELLQVVVTHKAPPGDVDAAALLDATQTDLAASPQEYKHYRAQLREEFAALPDLQYWKARRKFVRALLARPQIYASPGAAIWEAPARQNLEAELANLEGLIAKEDPHASIDDEPVEDYDPAATTSTIIIKKVGAKGDPIINRPEVDSFDPDEPHTETAPTPEATDEVENDGSSSLEDEPDVIERPSTKPVRRLSAKELARLARTSPEMAYEYAFTKAHANQLRSKGEDK